MKTNRSCTSYVSTTERTSTEPVESLEVFVKRIFLISIPFKVEGRRNRRQVRSQGAREASPHQVGRRRRHYHVGFSVEVGFSANSTENATSTENTTSRFYVLHQSSQQPQLIVPGSGGELGDQLSVGLGCGLRRVDTFQDHAQHLATGREKWRNASQALGQAASRRCLSNAHRAVRDLPGRPHTHAARIGASAAARTARPRGSLPGRADLLRPDAREYRLSARGPALDPSLRGDVQRF